MRAVISWWDLNSSGQTIESLRSDLLAHGVEEWKNVPGLRLKLWISDDSTNRWGAVMLWDDDAGTTTVMPANRAAQRIGYPATVRLEARVEATAQAQSSSTDGRPL
ncbi:hypothetical protein [Barrientosiimonas humi]|uniref:hypothetical protein n=1 Tax=Barrientosiimonas humi TaxID=999931 RepID=UPI00370DB801